jgi:hypothetical protein
LLLTRREGQARELDLHYGYSHYTLACLHLRLDAASSPSTRSAPEAVTATAAMAAIAAAAQADAGTPDVATAEVLCHAYLSLGRNADARQLAADTQRRALGGARALALHAHVLAHAGPSRLLSKVHRHSFPHTHICRDKGCWSRLVPMSYCPPCIHVPTHVCFSDQVGAGIPSHLTHRLRCGRGWVAGAGHV